MDLEIDDVLGLISENGEPRYADLDIITNKQLLQMDEYRSAYGTGALATFLSCLLPLSIIAMYVTLCVSFGIYAFSNPNNACFYGTSDAGEEFIKGV